MKIKLLLLIILVGVGLAAAHVIQQRKYDNPDFQNYKKGYLSCAQFTAANTAESYIYSQWKNHAVIGC